MLTLTDFRFATVEELFHYKQQNFELPPFPGYTSDQWGIKAHNRPWIEETGSFMAGQKIIEVGGAYSTLPVYLARKYNLEAWVGDDFGEVVGESETWTRWGDPHELPNIWADMNYVFKSFGEFSKEYQDGYFDRVFSVSTLEHIQFEKILPVLKDMHRVLAKKGIELHSIDIMPCSDISIGDALRFLTGAEPHNIDIAPMGYRNIIIASMLERLSLKLGINMFRGKLISLSPTWRWLKLIEKSGVDISIISSKNYPYIDTLLNKDTLFESYDVFHRFYPPNNSSKQYIPSASLLVVIKDV